MRRLLIVNFTCFLCACAAGSNIRAQETSTEPTVVESESNTTKKEKPKTDKQKTKFGFQKILDRYVTSNGAIAKVTKTVHLELLDEEKKSEGEIFFSKGKLRVDISEPDPSLIILNPEAIWVIIPENKDLGSKTQVTKIISNKDKKRSRAPLAHLLTDRSAWDLFKLKEEKEVKENIIETTLVPADKQKTPEVTSLKIKYDIKKSLILSLSYTDDIDNKTTYEFQSSNFDKIPDKKLFVYKPGKSDEVTVFE